MCRACVVKGDGLLKYSFPPPHPFNSARVVRFWEELDRLELGEVLVEPERADEKMLALFHDEGHIEFVRKASTLGYGFLDEGDTPAFVGVLEAAEFAVGSTLACLEKVLSGKADHAFNPVGGLHHARARPLGRVLRLQRHRGGHRDAPDERARKGAVRRHRRPPRRRRVLPL